MPEEGIATQAQSTLLNYDEITRVVRAFAGVGVRRVRLTGGEPLVRRDVPSLVQALRGIDGIDEVVMTTNGVLLPRHADALAEAGLKSVTVSLDSVDPVTFARITRGGRLSQVVEGITAARLAGLNVKLNAVIVRGINDHEVVDMLQWALARECTLRFIEFMPVGADTVWGDLPQGGCVPAAEIRARLAGAFNFSPVGRVSNAGPAHYYSIKGAEREGAPARFGMISAVTECFCDACNRLRLSPQGALRACLGDDSEISLRDAMRAGASDSELLDLVKAALRGKKATHSFDLEGGAKTARQMVAIGG